MRRPSPQTAALLVTALAFHVDMLLYYLLVPLLPRYARELGLNPMKVGILFGSYAVALLLATFPVAILTDKVGRRAPMLWGLAGLAITTLVFAISKQYWLLVLARFLQGIAGSATWLPGMALLADHFPSESRGRAMGTAFAAANLGVLIGPPLSGFLDQHAGPAAPFLLGAGLVALDAFGRATLLPEVEPERGPRLPFRQLLSNPTIRLFAGAMALGSGLWALLESTLRLEAQREQRVAPELVRGLALERVGRAVAEQRRHGERAVRWDVVLGRAERLGVLGLDPDDALCAARGSVERDRVERGAVAEVLVGSGCPLDLDVVDGRHG